MKHHILKGYTKYNPGPSTSLSKNQPSTSIRTRVHGMMFCGPHSYNLEYFLSMLRNITSNYKSPVTSPFIHDIQGSFLQSCTFTGGTEGQGPSAPGCDLVHSGAPTAPNSLASVLHICTGPPLCRRALVHDKGLRRVQSLTKRCPHGLWGSPLALWACQAGAEKRETVSDCLSWRCVTLLGREPLKGQQNGIIVKPPFGIPRSHTGLPASSLSFHMNSHSHSFLVLKLWVFTYYNNKSDETYIEYHFENMKLKCKTVSNNASVF